MRYKLVPTEATAEMIEYGSHDRAHAIYARMVDKSVEPDMRAAIRSSIKAGAPGLTDIVIDAIVRSAMLKIERGESTANQRE